MAWNFDLFGEKARSLAAIAALLSIPIYGAWYIFRLEERLRTVEAQVQAIATTPTI
jgi:hypothetical protein